MAANKDMQMKKYDLLCLLREDKAFEIEGVRKHCEMKLADSISKSKAWNPFSRGKNGRDLSTELLIPKHITEKWQSGELRALKGPFHLISTPPCRRRLRRGPENLYFLGVLKMVISEGNKKIAFS